MLALDANPTQRFLIMGVEKEINNINESGQAIFEVLIFMPILIFLYTIIFNIGSSINVSINQQKVTRRYFYYLNKGNSTLPGFNELEGWEGGFLRVGVSMIGYEDKRSGDKSLGPCFRFNGFLTGDTGETCEEPIRGEKATSFIRVFTAYGICGQTYSYNGSRFIVPEGSVAPDPRSNRANCAVSSNN